MFRTSEWQFLYLSLANHDFFKANPRYCEAAVHDMFTRVHGARQHVTERLLVKSMRQAGCHGYPGRFFSASASVTQIFSFISSQIPYAEQYFLLTR